MMADLKRSLWIVLLSVALATFCAEEMSSKSTLYWCINNCAICVKQWEPGLYNGPRCARKCLKHKGQKIVDPDCNKPRMFNYDAHILKKYLKHIRHHGYDMEDTEN